MNTVFDYSVALGVFYNDLMSATGGIQAPAWEFDSIFVTRKHPAVVDGIWTENGLKYDVYYLVGADDPTVYKGIVRLLYNHYKHTLDMQEL